MKNTIRRFAAVAAVSAALTGGLATAAFASGPSGGGPVSVSGQVSESVTLSNLSSSIAFPATAPGSTGTATGAENYQVMSNDPAGYSLSITPGGTAMQASGGGVLPNSALQVNETGTNGHGGNFVSGEVTVDTTSAPASRSYSEDWQWSIPGSQQPGNYSEQFTYLALGN
jgi:hypothetical protein